MDESTQIRDQTVPQTARHAGEGVFERGWLRTKLIIVRSVFWSYERGSWQYDLIVLAILAFIFLTPGLWFRDRPTLDLTDLRHHPGIVEESRGKEGWRYEVDARLVESLALQNPEDAVREILRRHLRKPFTVKSLEVIQDKNKVILGYRVVVAR